MLKRKFYDTLIEWKNNNNQSCLLVKGARQIGKTYIIDYFGKNNYTSYIYINFIESPQTKDIFNDELSAEEIYKRMTLIMPEIKFVENNTLIFLDEIQECPNARTALKFLAIDGRFDVVASGSLLGISYREVPSIPVGYETQVEMYSLDFEEYLWAIGYEESKISILKEYFDKQEKVPEAVHNTMMKHLREYITVGGMPAVVNQFIRNKHFGEVQEQQQRILDSYFDDISKYASKTEKPKVKNCYLSVPKQLAKENKKFQFSVVEKKATARKYENSVEWLSDANLVRLCYNVSTPEFPLAAYEKGEQYKMYLSDIGLLVALYGFEIKKTIIDDTLSGNAKGGIYENLIADMLIKRGYKLNYYRTDNGSVEVEFLISKDAKIIPIEVKANNGSTVSLNEMLKRNDIPYGYKLISGNVGVNDKKIVMPLYMAMFL
ncbi:MAG: ATP-binding protein [Ruminococcus flavefaciens]|nr:ATP-binding protein [Ruminococcus flavefaciens]MCM1060454.1 ATP-binding protein [Eubacterium sp.]